MKQPFLSIVLVLAIIVGGLFDRYLISTWDHNSNIGELEPQIKLLHGSNGTLTVCDRWALWTSIQCKLTPSPGKHAKLLALYQLTVHSSLNTEESLLIRSRLRSKTTPISVYVENSRRDFQITSALTEMTSTTFLLKGIGDRRGSWRIISVGESFVTELDCVEPITPDLVVLLSL